MKLPLIIFGVVIISVSAFAQNPAPPDHFVDVPKDHWAYEAVENLRSKGIVVGYPDTNYRGKRTMTRFELAAALDRALKSAQAVPGPKGPPGERGEKGDKGDRGPIGPRGKAPEDVAQFRKLLEELRVEAARLDRGLGAAGAKVDNNSKDASNIKGSLGPKR